jgi:hypothetical protein
MLQEVGRMLAGESLLVHASKIDAAEKRAMMNQRNDCNAFYRLHTREKHLMVGREEGPGPGRVECNVTRCNARQ